MASQRGVDIGNFFNYFAYGSSLLDEGICVQIKSAKYVSTGLLADYRLEFYDLGLRWMGALVSVKRSEGDEVWGYVLHVPWSFSDELDMQGNGYHRLNVSIKVGSFATHCRTYSSQRNFPSPHNLVLVFGASEHSLPSDCIKKFCDTGSVVTNNIKFTIPIWKSSD